jgi:hypothetical protein
MPTKEKKVKKPQDAPAMAIHAEHKDGVHHLVGLGNIRVLLMHEGTGWFAQGLEIDYAAQGDSLVAAKREFEDGLAATVEAHLQKHGSIRELLKVAPNEFWEIVGDPSIRLERYSQITQHHVIRENSNYEGIAYLIAAKINEGAEGTCQ